MAHLLIHVGYPKTGTTWLQNHLFANAELGFTSPISRQEMRFCLAESHPLVFDAESYRQRIQPILAEILKQDICPVLSMERFSGRAEVGGYDSTIIADRLAQLFPSAKILIIIREQKSIILSSYHQYIRAGGMHSIKGFLNPPIRKIYPFFKFAYFEYHRLINYYYNLFGSANVLVLLYEQFRTTPQSFLEQIITFSGLPAKSKLIKQLPFATPQNKSFSAPAIIFNRYTNSIIGQKDMGLARPLLYVPSRYRHRIIRLWHAVDARLPPALTRLWDNKLKATIAELVGDRYKTSNLLTAHLINIDLAQFGYDV